MKITIYAKGLGDTYRIHFEGSRIILRPTSGKPYKWLVATPKQIKKNFRLFPVFQVHHA